MLIKTVDLDPLAQFEILSYTSCTPLLRITNFTTMLSIIFTLIIVSLQFAVVNFKQNYIKTIILNSIRFVNKIINENTNLRRNQYILVLYFLFMFILFSNFIGLLPFS